MCFKILKSLLKRLIFIIQRLFIVLRHETVVDGTFSNEKFMFGLCVIFTFYKTKIKRYFREKAKKMKKSSVMPWIVKK